MVSESQKKLAEKYEHKTDRIQIKIEPSIKKAAQKLAASDGRTLSNYIVELIKREIKREGR